MIIKIGSPYTSSPGDPVQGYITATNNFTSDVVTDWLWAYGSYDASTNNFEIRGYLLLEGIEISAGATQTTYFYPGQSFPTPNDPGTWDLIGIIADDITVTETGVIITGLYDEKIVEDIWTISAVAELSITDVGIQGA